MKSIKRQYSLKSQDDFDWYDTKNGKKSVKKLSHKRARKKVSDTDEEADEVANDSTL